MRKVTFRVANSLDNYIARKDGSFDWILHSEESSSSLAEFWKTIDTVLWGRRTYDLVKGKMPAYQGVKNYVFSRTLKESADNEVSSLAGRLCCNLTQPRLARRYCDSLRRAATVLEVAAFFDSFRGFEFPPFRR